MTDPAAPPPPQPGRPSEDDLPAFAEHVAALADRRLAARPTSEASARRARQLRDHLVGHVLPRARSLDAPLVVLLVGPTGAGKSSLMNAIAGRAASTVGVLRPTTRDVVVLVRPDDRDALFAPGSSLASIEPRRMRVVADPSAPEGVAILDAPDVDSIDRSNRALTDRLVEAADLGIFVTTATRYADEVPWGVLDRLRERGLPLIVVANRLPADPEDRAIVLDDLRRLLIERGMSALAVDEVAGNGASLTVVPVSEGSVDATSSGLDASAVASILDRLSALSADREARRALALRALGGSLAGLGPLLDAIGDDLEHEAIDADALRRSATDTFQGELRRLRDELASGGFLRAEALRQWHAFVGADEITRFFSSGIGRLRGTISALFRGTPPAPVAEVRDETLADLQALARVRVGEAMRRTATAWSDAPSVVRAIEADSTLWSPSPDFEDRLGDRLESWIDSIGEDVRTTGAGKRTLAKGASLGVNVTGVGVMVATFAHTGGLTGVEVGVAAGTALLNQKLLEALFGEAALVEMIGRARRSLGDILTEAFRGELERFERLVPDGEELRSISSQVRSAASVARRLPLALGANARGVVGEPAPIGAASLAWPEEP